MTALLTRRKPRVPALSDFMDVKIVIALMLLGVAVVAFICLKVAKKHAYDDPEKVKVREERARLYREQLKEEIRKEAESRREADNAGSNETEEVRE